MMESETILNVISDGQENIYSPTTTSIIQHDTSGNCVKKLYHRFFPLGYKSELKMIFKLAWPTVLVQFSEQFLFMISLMFCGHIGKNQLDGAAMALTLINVAGCSILQGLAAGCETLFSQTYGSKNKKQVGIILQQSIIILGMVCLPCWAVLINVDHILLLVSQPTDVAQHALQYSLYFIPGVPGYALCMILIRYIRCQSIVIPSLIIGIITNLLTAVYHAMFIYWWKLGVRGAGAALSLGFWTSGILHIVYIKATKIYRTTWSGLSWKCLEGWKLYISLALPGMLMLCLEWWSFEVLVFLAGTLGTTSLAAHSILYQMAAIMFMTPLGLAQSACVRVGNLLGEGLHQMAANSAHVIVSFTFFIAAFDAILLCSFKDLIPLGFTQDRDVIELTSNLLLILAVFHVADALEGVASGVLRGTGQQRFGAVINLIAYYIVGLPIAIVLIFYTPLGIAGAWWGICFGSTFQCVSFFIKICFLNWVEESKKASLRAGVKTTKIDGVQDECTVSEGEDNQQLIEADHLLLTESPSLNSINSNDTEYMESEYNRKRRLILIRLIPFLCCVMFLIIGIVVHEYLKEFTAHQHCVLIHGHDFNLTYIHELLMDPQEHNLTKDDVDMLNTTYYFESQNFGNQTFVYCPHNAPDFYDGDYKDFNQTKLYKLFYPRLTFHPLG